MEQSYATTGTTTVTGPPDILTPLINYLRDTDFLGIFSVDATVWFSQFWFGYSIFAYLLSLGFLYLFIYASIRYSRIQEDISAGINTQREAYQSTYGKSAKRTRWDDVFQHLESNNPNDWKLAIIESDIMLDEFLKSNGYAGSSLGERLKGISPHSLRTLDDAWEAHKVRNQVAHGGADFLLTQKLARDTIARYRSVFTELGML